jgi:peroxiredoxin
MEKAKKPHVWMVISLAVVVVAGFMIFKLLRINTQLRAHIPYLLPGEKIEYFDLVDGTGRKINSADLSNPRPGLIIIFSQPCSGCDKNIPFWKKIADVAGEKIKIYGVVLDSYGAAFEFENRANLNFSIYAPEDIGKFKESLRIKFNYAQTLVYHKGVKFSHVGELENRDTVKIIKLIRNLISKE